MGDEVMVYRDECTTKGVIRSVGGVIHGTVQETPLSGGQVTVRQAHAHFSSSMGDEPKGIALRFTAPDSAIVGVIPNSHLQGGHILRQWEYLNVGDTLDTVGTYLVVIGGEVDINGIFFKGDDMFQLTASRKVIALKPCFVLTFDVVEDEDTFRSIRQEVE